MTARASRNAHAQTIYLAGDYCTLCSTEAELRVPGMESQGPGTYVDGYHAAIFLLDSGTLTSSPGEELHHARDG